MFLCVKKQKFLYNKDDFKKYEYADKICKKCNVKVTPSNWSRHLKTDKHMKKDPEQSIKPKSRKPTKPLLNLETHIKSLIPVKHYLTINKIFVRLSKPKKQLSNLY